MKEKLQTLSLVQLKEIAREQGFKGVSNLNKANLIDLLVEFSENQNKPIAKSEGGSSEVATRENSYQRDNCICHNVARPLVSLVLHCRCAVCILCELCHCSDNRFAEHSGSQGYLM